MYPQSDVGTSSTVAQQLIPKIIYTALDEPKTRPVLEMRQEANTQVGAAVPNGCQGSSHFSGYSYPTGEKSIPKSLPNFFPSHSPADAGLSRGDRNTVVHPTSLQDYPSSRAVIQMFEGDPLIYWPFVRSFEAHIARKMPCDSVKLVYLFQHCSPNIRKNLEHVSRDADSGYKLVRESLFNDFGLPHVIAHSCEQKLLNASRLKDKDAPGLKTMAILME